MNSSELLDRLAARRAGVSNQKLQIYLHIPFCSTKCLFCDWVDDIPVAQLKSGPEVRGRYVEAVCRQIEFWGPQLTLLGYKPTTIYWGGGTPTRLKAEDFARIGGVLENAFDLSELQQHTMESTPNDMTAEKLAALVSVGVDRLSFGVQSFDPDQLRRAGRGHSVEQAVETVKMCLNSPIKDVNLDLISGFPGETAPTFVRTLEAATALQPSHISVYSYRATPKTMMAMQITRGARSALRLEDMIDSYELAQDVLGGAGYREYCFNYFARDKQREFTAGLYTYELAGDIIGFGAGAGSTIGGMQLRNSEVELHRYLDDPLEFSQVHAFGLDRPESLFPLFGGALMTQRGLDFERFENLTGLPFDQVFALPEVKAWFKYIENCGARLVREKDRLVCPRENIHRIYLRNLSYALNPALQEADV